MPNNKLCLYTTKNGVDVTPHYLINDTKYGYVLALAVTTGKCFVFGIQQDSAAYQTLGYHGKIGATGSVTTTYVDQAGNNVTSALKTVLEVPNDGFKPMEIKSTVTAWNQEIHMGYTTPNVTLPAITNETISEELRFTWIALTANASFTAPSGAVLGDSDGYAGLATGNTLAYTDLTPGSIYEVSIARIIDTANQQPGYPVLSLVMVERTGIFDG